MRILILVLAVNCLSALNRYEIGCNEQLLTASLDSAIAQAGTTERTNRNDGYVEKYLKLFKLRRASYCAVGQYWCFYTAVMDLGMSINSIPIYKTAVASDMYYQTRKDGVKVSFKPRRHDLIFWKMRNSWKGHVERIVKVHRKGWVTTIAFNTDSRTKSGKKIEGVFFKRRNIYHPIGRKLILGIIGFKAEKK